MRFGGTADACNLEQNGPNNTLTTYTTTANSQNSLLFISLHFSITRRASQTRIVDGDGASGLKTFHTGHSVEDPQDENEEKRGCHQPTEQNTSNLQR